LNGCRLHVGIITRLFFVQSERMVNLLSPWLDLSQVCQNGYYAPLGIPHSCFT
jgi:hypothetical protein